MLAKIIRKEARAQAGRKRGKGDTQMAQVEWRLYSSLPRLETHSGCPDQRTKCAQRVGPKHRFHS